MERERLISFSIVSYPHEFMDGVSFPSQHCKGSSDNNRVQITNHCYGNKTFTTITTLRHSEASMASLSNSPALHRVLFVSGASSHQMASRGPVVYFTGDSCRVGIPFRVRAEASPLPLQEKHGRRGALALGVIATTTSLSHAYSATFAAESLKGFQAVLDKKDGYSFVYPFGWQEVVIQGQDKVFKDVIEPLESASINIVATTKQDVRELGSPKEVAEILIKKVLAPPSQKTKLIEASEHDVDGKAYYTFEFIAQAPNFTRHALGAISVGNGKFYTLTTGANERRWEKMKDRLHTIVDSFKLFSV